MKNIIKNIKKNCGIRFKSILAVLVVFMLFVNLKTANAQYNISITGDAISLSTINTTRTQITSITTGSTFVYLIQYATQSNTQTGSNLVATISLPANLVPINTSPFSSSINFPSTQVNSATYNSLNNTVTITFNSPLPAGSSGEIQLSLRYINGITVNGYAPNLTTTITQTTANSPSPVFSDTTIVTAIAANNFTIGKFRNSGGAINDITIYRLNIGSTASSTGSLNLIDPFVTDVLAPGVEFVEATAFSGSNLPVYDAMTRTITWTWPNSFNGNTGDFSTSYNSQAFVVVKYPNTSFALGNNVSNTATLTGTAFGETSTTNKTGSVNFNLAAPTPNGKCTGGQITASTASWISRHVLSGTTGNTFNNGWQNVGNTQLDSISLTYTIDKCVDVKTIGINMMRDGLGRDINDTVILRYKTNLHNAYRFWPSSPIVIDANQSFNMSSLSLGVNEYVTDVNFVFYGQLPIGSSQTLNYAGTVRTASEGAKDGSPITEGTTYITANPGDDGTLIYNSSTGYYIYNSSLTNYSGCPGFSEILKPQPVFNTLNKSTSTSSLRASDTASFSINVQLGGNVSATNVIFTDTLNSKFKYIVGSGNILSSNNPNASTPITPIVTNDSIINWNLGTLVVGKTYTINFKAQVKPGTLPITIPNNAYINSTNALFPANIKGTTSVTVISNAAVVATKSQNGCDTTFVNYPTNASTKEGGLVNYKVVIQNQGNVAARDLTLIDVFPFIGDNRGSQWFANLVGPIINTDPNTTIYYTTTNNACYSTDLVGAFNPPSCNTPVWSTTAPTDITSVKGIKINRVAVLGVLDSIVISWPMRVPVGTPSNITMNNTTYYQVSRNDIAGSAGRLSPASPNQVGMVTSCSPLLGSIGNYVWYDADTNGIQNEPAANGINGVKINLYGVGPNNVIGGGDDILLDSTFSGNDFFGKPGYYKFVDIPSGIYYVNFQPNYSNFTQSPIVNQANQTNLNNDAQVGTGNSGLITINGAGAGQDKDNTTIDAGYYIQGSIGNYVWYDDNNNGLQDEDPSNGINGITVNLLKDNGTGTYIQVATTSSANDGLGNPGYYNFPNLLGGNYKVQFPTSIGNYPVSGTTTQTAKINGNNDANSTTGLSGIAVLNPILGGFDKDNTTIDAGYRTNIGSLGNYVWLDSNGDGVQNESASNGVNGVIVNLLKDNGTGSFVQVATTTTANNGSGNLGYYNFPNLNSGNYKVEFPLTNNDFGLTTTNQTAQTDNNSDAAALTGLSGIVIINTASLIALDINNPTIDAGYIPVGSIGNYVWLDDNYNGVQDEGVNRGVNGLTINLLKDDGTGNFVQIATTISADSNGNPGYYNFPNLLFGTYKVQFPSAVGRYALTGTFNQSGQINGDNDADGSGLSGAVVINPLLTALNKNNPTIDAGYATNIGSIGNYIWLDGNGNGVQDEPAINGINGVTVNLLKDNGFGTFVQFATTITADSNGNPGYYYFPNLTSGNYKVEFPTSNNGKTLTTANQTNQTNGNSDANSLTGLSDLVIINVASLNQLDINNTTIDAGYLCNLAVTLTPVSGNCSNNNLASITTSVTGGTASSYMWSNNATTSSINNISVAGIYSITVNDNFGCVANGNATITITPCCNVTSGGTIMGAQVNCGPFNPTVIGNTALPAGGLGTIEYVWLKNKNNVPNNNGNNGWELIVGANGATYDPGMITETTYYIRCARRSGCIDYLGESNIIAMIVNSLPSAGFNINDTVQCLENNLFEFTNTSSSFGLTQTIWPTYAIGSVPNTVDNASVELGVKFRSSTNGIIKGIRFYKLASSTGTFVGKLYTSSGTLLSSATFTTTASGWQEVLFTTPVSVVANTTYIASYYAPNGGYAFDANYFTASAIVNGDLKALKDGEDGGNGVFYYGVGGGFPNNTYYSANYWVDVVFAPQSNLTNTWYFGDATTATTVNASKTYAVAGNKNVKLVVENEYGCKDSIIKQLFAGNPTASFTYTKNCKGEVIFNNTSTNATDYEWIIGDSTICTTTSIPVQKLYSDNSASGTNYLVTLIAKNNSLCYDTFTQMITIYPPAISIFSATPIGCSTKVNFNNFTMFGNSYTWDFGVVGLTTDTSSLMNSTYTYPSNGTYQVSLISNNTEGCGDTLTLPVVVNQNGVTPTANFTISNVSNSCAKRFNFTNTSVNGVSYQWIFNDGSQVYTTNASKSYATAGTYAVKLIAKSSTGCFDTIVKNVTVIGNSAATVASFIVSNRTQCLANNSFEFYNTSVHMGPYWIPSYNWDFGDGTFDNSNSYVFNKHYTTAGIYTVRMIAIGSDGCRDTAYQSVEVLPSPIASFTANTSCGMTAQINNQSTGAIANIWNFGTGYFEENNASSFSYTYEYEDWYFIDLTVVGANGCKNNVHVGVYPTSVGAPTANFTYDTLTCSNAIKFTNTSIGGASAIWNFGDGSPVSTLFNPTHVYNVAGIYTVTLTLNNGPFCSATYTQTVNAPLGFNIATPTAKMSYNVAACSNTISAIDSSSNSYLRKWFFDGVLVSILPTVSITNPTEGGHELKLVVSNGTCYDTINQFILIQAVPVSAVSHTSSTCSRTVVFSSQATNGNTYNWNFNDAGSSINTATGSVVTHTFSANGTYYVSLTSTNLSACITSTIDTVVVNAGNNPINAAFKFDNHTCNCVCNNKIKFTNLSTGTGNTYFWSFGDGSTSTQTSPNKGFAAAGTFNVTLTATSPSGCISVSTMQISILPIAKGPSASFNTDNQVQCLTGNNFSFYNTSSYMGAGWNTKYYWNFGDGTIDTMNTFVFNKHYTAVGTYTVTLVALGSDNCKDTMTMTVIVRNNNCLSYSNPIQVFNPSNHGVFEQAASSTTTKVTEQIESKNNWTLYPNPNAGKFSVSSKNINNASQIQVIDVLGREVSVNITRMNAENRIDLEMNYVSSGYYFIIIKNESGQDAKIKFNVTNN
ncbi:MAG: SdrD B-like domain-containing protein [Bacteroidota bacterium]